AGRPGAPSGAGRAAPPASSASRRRAPRRNITYGTGSAVRAPTPTTAQKAGSPAGMTSARNEIGVSAASQGKGFAAQPSAADAARPAAAADPGGVAGAASPHATVPRSPTTTPPSVQMSTNSCSAADSSWGRSAPEAVSPPTSHVPREHNTSSATAAGRYRSPTGKGR